MNVLSLAARAPSAPTEMFLGPAIVLDASGPTLTARLEDGAVVSVELALQLPYEAADDDVLLVIGNGDRHYGIGVIAARGRTTLGLQGNVTLRAVGGALDLVGDRGVRISGPEVDVETGTLRTIARAAVGAFETFTQRVAQLLTVHAGQSQTIVDEGAFTQAKTAAIQAEDAVTINGKEILLG